MLKKLSVLLFLCALCMWAADFWTTKPFTDWNEKEVQKVLTDSPWVGKVTMSTPGGGGGAGGEKIRFKALPIEDSTCRESFHRRHHHRGWRRRWWWRRARGRSWRRSRRR